MTTDDNAYDWPYVNPEAIRAHLDHDEWWESLTDEQRAALTKRRAILGSLDDTHALNRDERGTAESVLVVGIALAVTGLWLASSLQPWQVVGLLACSAYAIGCWVLCRGARHGAEIRDRLDADAPKGGARR